MNLRDRQPRKTDQINDDDDEDIVLKSEEPDESHATIENDREKVSDGVIQETSEIRILDSGERARRRAR